MPTSASPDRISSAGQIALERMLFCVACECIIAGTGPCLRCAGEGVWPRAEWLPHGRQDATVSNRRVALAGMFHHERGRASAGPSPSERMTATGELPHMVAFAQED
jgi:hypothetical protein